MKRPILGLRRLFSAPITSIAVVLLFGMLTYNPARAQKIFAGPDGYSGCAIDANGNLYTWGIDQYFQTVVSSTAGNAQDLSPIQVGFPSGVTSWTSASVGNLFTLAIGSDGNVYAWGLNSSGQLGNGTTTNSSVPSMVSLPGGVTAKAVSAGTSFGLAIGSDGNIYAWGLNSSGQLGDSITADTSKPVKVSLPSGVTAKEIFAAPAFSLAIGSDGNIYAWGSNSTGQLGNGTTTNSSVPVMVKMPSGVTATAISAGSSFSLAIGSDGNIYAWGGNGFGQLGNGTKTNSSVPVLVSMPSGVTGKVIAGGRLFSSAIGSDGKVYIWGDNLYGELANSTVDVPKLDSIPVAISMPSGVTATGLAAIRWSGYVIGSNNDVYSWGYNQEGELGIGTKTGAPKYAIGTATVIPNFVLAQPRVPSLLSPANNAVNRPDSLVLEWNKASSATEYLCQLSSDPTFATNLIVNDSTVTDTTDTASGLAVGTEYYWRVLSENNGVMSAFSAVDSFEFKPGTGILSVNAPERMPKTFALLQNFPNPFNPTTMIKYSLPKAQMVTLKVYNVLGQEVTTLVNARQNAGYYSVNFNADRLASGVYFYVLRTESFSSTHKMMLLK